MSSIELREQVIRYLVKEISLQELEEWLAPRLKKYIARVNAFEANLIAAIELCLAEYSEGLRDEQQIRSELAGLLEEPEVIVFPERNAWTEVGSSSSEQEWKSGYNQDLIRVHQISIL